jgi:hypothetical protein
MGLEIEERRAYVQLLAERIAADNAAAEELASRWKRG